MAAPSGTKWGSKKNDKGRIGIAISRNYDKSTVKVTLSVWFWSKYGVSNSGNTLYLNNKATSASSSKGSCSIYTSHSSGSGWSTNNQKKIYSQSYTLDRYTTTRTINCAAKLSGVDWVGDTMTVSTSYTIDALPKYTINYSVGNGSGGPSAGTAYHGKSYTIPEKEPTPPKNLTFIYWDSNGTEYQPGDVIKNVTSNKTLTAAYMGFSIESETNRIYLKFNSNGGRISSSTYQDVDKGSSATFIIDSGTTREGYAFKNWNTQKDGNGTSYNVGSSITIATTTTLYAQWIPLYHTIKYYTSEGDPWIKDGVEITQKKEVDTAVQILGPPDPIDNNYIFRHWVFKDPDNVTSIATANLLTPGIIGSLEEAGDLDNIYVPGQSYTYNKSNGETYLIAEWREASGIVFYESGAVECNEIIETDELKEGIFYTDGTISFSSFNENNDGSILFKKNEEIIDNIASTKEVTMSAFSFKEID